NQDSTVHWIVEPGDEAGQRRLASSRWTDDCDDLAWARLEGNVLERIDAPYVIERHVVEAHTAGGAQEAPRLGCFLDVRLRVEDVETHPQANQVVLQRPERVADRLERLIDGGDVG